MKKSNSISPESKLRINSEAEELNSSLKKDAPIIYEMLTDYGKQAAFPNKGIIAQSEEAKKTKLNASVGQAFENNKSPMILDALSQQINISKTAFLYSPSSGQKDLRNVWKEMILKKSPSVVSSTRLSNSTISMPVVTSGITNGLYLVGKLFVKDSVIIPDMMWENYKLIFNNAKLDTLPLFEARKENGRNKGRDKGDDIRKENSKETTGFNISGLKKKLSSQGDKVVLLNFPNNPTGYTILKSEADEIAKVIKECADRGNNVVIIIDDAYFGLFYEDEIFHESIFSKLCCLHERVLAIKVDGITKEIFAWGLRVGFITYGYKGMTEKTASILENKTVCAVRATISNVCTLSQMMALNTLTSENFNESVHEKYESIKEKYMTVKNCLSKNKKYSEFFEPMPFNSGYFMCLMLKKHDAESVRRVLIDKYSTGTIAQGKVIRIAYSCVSIDEIPKVFENIYLVCKGLR